MLPSGSMRHMRSGYRGITTVFSTNGYATIFATNRRCCLGSLSYLGVLGTTQMTSQTSDTLDRITAPF